MHIVDDPQAMALPSEIVPDTALQSALLSAFVVTEIVFVE
jgi:hypothetical protein